MYGIDIGLLYSIVAAVSLLVVIILFFRTRATRHKEIIDTHFCKLLIFMAVFCFVDMVWGALTSEYIDNNREIYVIFTYGFHAFAAVSAFMWAGYAARYAQFSDRERHIVNVLRYIFVLIQLGVLISNNWNHYFFSIDENGVYHAFVLRNFMFAMQFAYYVILIIFSFVKYLIVKDETGKRLYLSTLAFSVVPLAFGFGQMIWSDGPMYSLGFMVTAILIYSFNITAQREQYLEKVFSEESYKLNSIILGLSRDCEAVMYLDLEDGTYEAFTNSETYKEKVANYIDESGYNFFEERLINVKRIVYKDDIELVEKMLSKESILAELENKNVFSFNYRLNIEGEPKYYLMKIIRAYNDDSHVIIGVFDDDERIRREAAKREELEKAMLAAEAASKAKSTFLFNMSHDIRTPMNAILGFNRLAGKHADDKEYLKECLDKVKISGEHLLALINDVLDMSRIESGTFKITPAPQSITVTVDYLCSIAAELASARSIKFTFKQCGIKDEYAEFDLLHLNQVILNVLSNAIKYTSPGGHVDFFVTQKEDMDDKAVYSFTVTDNGLGMTKEFLDRIFEEFARENTATVSGVEGTGLGMSIVKRILDFMGGTIDIQSEKGKGTRVEVVVPFVKSDSAKIAKDDYIADKTIIIPKGKCVLLVDDNALNREISRDLLEEIGIEVEEVSDGLYAVDRVFQNGALYYDAILMDIQMPLMNGFEATRRIRELCVPGVDKIPIIAMTANAFEEDRQNAFEAGMNDHIAKPVNIRTLEATLVKYLA